MRWNKIKWFVTSHLQVLFRKPKEFLGIAYGFLGGILSAEGTFVLDKPSGFAVVLCDFGEPRDFGVALELVPYALEQAEMAPFLVPIAVQQSPGGMEYAYICCKKRHVEDVFIQDFLSLGDIRFCDYYLPLVSSSLTLPLRSNPLLKQSS
jgi:hypothetical protein